jgi:poly(A) polymerase
MTTRVLQQSTYDRAAMVPKQVARLVHTLSEGSDVTTTRVAGGAVRDMLTGDAPKDWDLATILLPEAVTEMAGRAGFTVIPTGLQHGTVTVMVGGMPLEVTTLRSDVETDGRHAEVEFITSWKEDAKRRDLTMNALFMDVDGLVWDYVGGMDDLKTGTVRFVGKPADRIKEDYLRILRFFRFAGRMGCAHFDPEALRSTLSLSPNLNKISGERVWMEMSKILTGGMLTEVLQHMEHAGVLAAIGIANPDIRTAVVANAMCAKPETVLAALVGKVGVANNLANTWKMSKDERKTLEFVTAQCEVPHYRSSMDWKRVAVQHSKELVMQALCLTERPGWLHHEILENWTVPTFPLTGADILALGVEAGPDVGRRLKACKQAWMDANFELTKDELTAMAETV